MEHNVATLLAEKMTRNYNLSLLRPHGKPIFFFCFCFIEYSEAYYIVIKPYLLFVNGGLLVNLTPSPPFDICIFTSAALRQSLTNFWSFCGSELTSPGLGGYVGPGAVWRFCRR
jgi:hypothetical protein